ncbi:GGDEF domain-containing protein [Planomonospora sp. ID91781]|uniref:GGDEF domain-containing protein n=1 Tax=Planomonospora sp. ID91781 TaxID=2738135 RepID=UPI0018C3CCD6|nr:GGDEF domain-containing protein [Planomonospora sp. ID91781]MBG0823678.1 GGDEF domain-containing protein [Planomonospora sp. ID91781]
MSKSGLVVGGTGEVMVWYLATGAALLAAYVFTTLAGAPAVVGIVLGQVALMVSLAAVAIGARRYRPATRWPWLLILGMLLVVVGGFFPSGVLAGTASPPSAADVFYLLSYAVGVWTQMTIVRSRTPAWSLPGLLDAGIITVSAALLSWIYVIDPILSDTDAGLPTRLVAAAYPLGDLLLAAFCARHLLDGGPKGVAAYSLAGYVMLTVIPDTLNTLDALAGETRWTFLVSVLWMAGGLLLGLCGTHPSMRDVDAPSAVAAPDLGPARLTMLALASLLAPAALLVQYLRGAPLYVPLICASCGLLFLLVIGRLAGLVAIQRRMAVTDALTGLWSRRYLDGALSGLAGRRNRRAAVLLLDIDHFKRVNDTYGHDGGDRVLREVAQRLSQAVRRGDVSARYGGEEFVVLLPDTAPDDARVIADRILTAVRSEPITVGGDVTITVTVSIGVACLPADVSVPGELTLLADQMLYRAKESGRNRVVTTSDTAVVTAAA